MESCNDTADSRQEYEREGDGSSSRARRVVSTRDLFSGEREIVIQHGANTYFMRITRQGKLILNK